MKRNKKPILLTDVDGVLLDWVKTFGEYAKAQGYNLRQEHPTTWEMTEWFGADIDTIRRLITEMNSSKIFAEIPPFEDAMKVLPKLAEKYDLVAITCCSDDATTVARRKKNLEVLKVDFKDVHCLKFTESKKDLLSSYHTTLWVEDRFEGAKSGVETGHKSFLINRPYNLHENHDEIVKVDSWHQIQKFLRLKK
jgi:uncharacterized HAD superfamily protein